MSTTEQQQFIQHHRICAAKGCSRLGTFEMEILFLGRNGWFCEQCKDNLMRDGLLLQQQKGNNILNGSYDEAIKGCAV